MLCTVNFVFAFFVRRPVCPSICLREVVFRRRIVSKQRQHGVEIEALGTPSMHKSKYFGSKPVLVLVFVCILSPARTLQVL